MENQKEYCENLYSEYKKLVEKTRLEVHDSRLGEKIHPKNIDIEDMKERVKVEEKLHDCLKFLTNEQLKEFFDDLNFAGEAVKILSERHKKSIEG